MRAIGLRKQGRFGFAAISSSPTGLCGHIEIKTDRNGRDEKHCGSTTEVLLSP